MNSNDGNLVQWEEYINGILRRQEATDGVTLGPEGRTHALLPIVKASVALVDCLNREKALNTILAFPGGEDVLLDFLVALVIHSVDSGVIEKTYNPSGFIKGQKLKYKDAIVMFDGYEKDEDGREYICLKFSDSETLRRRIPLASAPPFQQVETKLLSKAAKFSKLHNEYKKSLEGSPVNTPVDVLANYRTHLESSIVYVSPVKKAKDLLLDKRIGDNNLSDVLYLAYIDSDDNVSNLTPGQMQGNPAIVIAPDLYSVRNAYNRLKIGMIVLDATVPSVIENQLDVIDEFNNNGHSIICITDIKNYFDDDDLIERGYVEWVWDRSTITQQLYNESNSTADTLNKNCVNQNNSYCVIDETIISETISRLYKYKNSIQEQSSNLITIYERAFSLMFRYLRSITPLNSNEKAYIEKIIDDCNARLEEERRYANPNLIQDFKFILDNLRTISKNKNMKQQKVQEIIKDNPNCNICIVASNSQDTAAIQHFWQPAGRKKQSQRITVVTAREYARLKDCVFDVTIIVGWLNQLTMRNLLFNFASPNNYVLLYPYEERWRRPHMRIWGKKIKKTQNDYVVQEYLETDKPIIGLTAAYIENDIEDDIDKSVREVDELADIEWLLLTSRYQKYKSVEGVGPETINAIPISYAGGLLSFYRKNHKLITVTGIIHGKQDFLKLKDAEKITPGELVVVRESERDVIREIADGILREEGKSKLRDLSGLWKKTLETEALFSSHEEIYEKLKSVGCRRDYLTVRNWMVNEELIAPQDKEDLVNIAKVTNDNELLEKVEIVYLAGKEVKSAHIKAGRKLSERLKEQIRTMSQSVGDVDLYNVWDPVSIRLDEIGTVKILKVLDVGKPVLVESAMANRLINEQEEK